MPPRTASAVQVHQPRGITQPNGLRAGFARTIGIVLFAILIGLATHSQAFWKPTTLPPVDRRLERQSGRASAPDPAQQIAEQALRTRIPSVRLELDPIRQVPIHCTLSARLPDRSGRRWTRSFSPIAGSRASDGKPSSTESVPSGGSQPVWPWPRSADLSSAEPGNHQPVKNGSAIHRRLGQRCCESPVLKPAGWHHRRS